MRRPGCPRDAAGDPAGVGVDRSRSFASSVVGMTSCMTDLARCKGPRSQSSGSSRSGNSMGSVARIQATCSHRPGPQREQTQSQCPSGSRMASTSGGSSSSQRHRRYPGRRSASWGGAGSRLTVDLRRTTRPWDIPPCHMLRFRQNRKRPRCARPSGGGGQLRRRRSRWVRRSVLRRSFPPLRSDSTCRASFRRSPLCRRSLLVRRFRMRRSAVRVVAIVPPCS